MMRLCCQKKPFIIFQSIFKRPYIFCAMLHITGMFLNIIKMISNITLRHHKTITFNVRQIALFERCRPVKRNIATFYR